MKQLDTAIERIKSMEERFDMLLDAAKTDLNLINTDPVLAGKLSEHADQLRDLAEYLLKHETIEAEEFNYFFEHGEFMPISAKKIREVRQDATIERPARKISMVDGYAEEKVEAVSAPEAEAQSENATDAQSLENAEPSKEEENQ